MSVETRYYISDTGRILGQSVWYHKYRRKCTSINIKLHPMPRSESLFSTSSFKFQEAWPSSVVHMKMYGRYTRTLTHGANYRAPAWLGVLRVSGTITSPQYIHKIRIYRSGNWTHTTSKRSTSEFTWILSAKSHLKCDNAGGISTGS